jgi:hypothetical protein
MDCPNCGVYNPESRDICWRCDKPLPKPTPPKKKRDSTTAMRRMWIIMIVVLVTWIVISLVLSGLLTR